MALLYADENFPVPVVVELRRLGHDVLTLHESGKSGQKFQDDEVLAFATSMGRAVLTLDRRDFIQLHGLAPEHAGIVVCTFDPDFAGQARRIHEALVPEVDLPGQLVRVQRPATTQ